MAPRRSSSAPPPTGRAAKAILSCSAVGALLAGSVLALAPQGAAAPASGPDPHLAHAEERILARAKVSGTYRFRADGPSDLLTVRVAIPAGAQIPWHRALGATLVSVRSGTFTLQAPTRSGCPTRHYRAGTGVVVPARQVHRGRNTGSGPVRLLVTYVGLPRGAAPEEPARPPANCR